MLLHLKYIITQIFISMYTDLKKFVLDMSHKSKSPNDVLNWVFILFIVAMLVEKYWAAIVCTILFVVIYVWKIVKQGEWKHRMRMKYKQ